ncbi:MAG TPA: C45 family peptidase, partial [Polyangiaceae bacterium LLY-WYZ-15_(1-7)]|nr:C45 family peptidase [Polyangiaceae bacterium LLY-WYZ-15_(1-7)]
MSRLAPLIVDLEQPPEARWAGLAPHAAAVRELCATYLEDLGGLDEYGLALALFETQCVPAGTRAELDAVAALAGLPHAEVALANLYYDAMKVAFSGLLGCTAVAVETPAGPLHARNLDWHAPNDVLGRLTQLTELRRGDALVARTVGWPGFVGAFSGVAPGRFALSLNAVLSEEAPRLAPSIALLLRDVLERAPSFDAALERLAESEIASDCLLLLTGTAPGERVVIERTPTRYALRRSEGPLVVTNDYRALEGGGAAGLLGATACARFDRAAELAAGGLDPEAAFALLSDDAVRMAITVQQMAFRAATGEVWIGGERVPAPGSEPA